MVQFFIKHKKTRGVITIFLTIIYLAVYIFAGVFVDGARIKMAQTVIEDVQQIATENIMSQYDRGLYEYYGLMATCGYDPDTIAKGVQSEIKAAIGMEFDDNEIKSFIKAVTEEAIYAKSTLIGGKSEKEEKESNFLSQFFTPYDLDIKVASVSTIDLTNIDVLRAQIRDEMRYKFPIILGASFFDELEQFLILGNAADKIKSIVDEISEGNESVIYKQSVYYENVNKFYDEYYKFLQELYGNNDELNDNDFEDDIEKGLNKVIDGIKAILINSFGAVINLAQFISGIDISGKSRDFVACNHRKAICKGIVEIDDKFDEDKFAINKFAIQYNSQPWPQANDYYYISNEDESDEEDYEPEYELDKEEFKSAIDSRAPERLNAFGNSIEEFKKKIDGLLDYTGDKLKYVKNIDLPSLTDFIGYGAGFLTDVAKSQFVKVKNTLKEINFKNVVSGIVGLLNVPKDIFNAGKKQIEEIVKDSKVVGIISIDRTIGIENLFPQIELELGGLDELIKAHDDYMKEIEDKLKYFAEKYEEYYGDKDNPKIEDIYATYLEMFLISWVELKIDSKVYHNIKLSIENLKQNFNDSYTVTKYFSENIIDDDLESVYEYVFDKGDDESSKEEPDHLKELLKDKQSTIVENIRKHIRNINIDSKEYLDRFNDIDSLQSSLFRLLQAVFNIMSSNKMNLFGGKHEVHSMDEWIKLGKSPEEARELINSGGTTMHIDPWGHIEPYDKAIYPTESQDDISESSFDVFKIVSTVMKILSIPVDIAERVPKEFTNDMNDVSYILSFFRDYVHTYRARELSVFDKNGNKDDKYDNFLNAKFVKDQHKTEYLTNSQFEDIEVTPAEIEYILFGNEGENSNVTNVIKMYASIFLIRTAINYVSVFFSPDALGKVTELSSSLGPFAPLGIIFIPLVYALPQAAIDTKNMVYDCEKVTFFNTGFGLFDPYKNAIFDEIKESTSKIGDRAKNVLMKSKEKIKKGFEGFVRNEIRSTFSHDSILHGQANAISALEMPTILIVLNNIDGINGVPDNVKRARNQLERWLNKKVYEIGIQFLIDDDSTNSGDISAADVSSEGTTTDNKGFKTGYSSYLTILLFLFGCTTDGKIEQMTRVQNVIETNMKKVYKMNGKKEGDLFKLRNSYVRVAVETECSINYIFMTSSFMPTHIKFKDNDRFRFNIKTASAY